MNFQPGSPTLGSSLVSRSEGAPKHLWRCQPSQTTPGLHLVITIFIILVVAQMVKLEIRITTILNGDTGDNALMVLLMLIQIHPQGRQRKMILRHMCDLMPNTWTRLLSGLSETGLGSCTGWTQAGRWGLLSSAPLHKRATGFPWITQSILNI